jgi:uncharacterized protein YqgV (UPF0045/DUF77 family)
VDEAIKVVAQSGLPYEVGPMETTIEGEPMKYGLLLSKLWTPVLTQELPGL